MSKPCKAWDEEYGERGLGDAPLLISFSKSIPDWLTEPIDWKPPIGWNCGTTLENTEVFTPLTAKRKKELDIIAKDLGLRKNIENVLSIEEIAVLMEGRTHKEIIAGCGIYPKCLNKICNGIKPSFNSLLVLTNYFENKIEEDYKIIEVLRQRKAKVLSEKEMRVLLEKVKIEPKEELQILRMLDRKGVRFLDKEQVKQLTKGLVFAYISRETQIPICSLRRLLLGEVDYVSAEYSLALNSFLLGKLNREYEIIENFKKNQKKT